MKRTIPEISLLTVSLLFIMVGVCWGPPGPPSTPVSSAESVGLTAALIAGYGIWKRRK